MAVPLPLSGAAERDDRRRGRVDGEDSATVRAHRVRRRLLLHRAVVPEAGRARERRLEHAPVSCGHRVLLGLRRLRRAHDRAGWLRPRCVRTRDGADGQRRRHRRRTATSDEDIHDFAWTASPDYIDVAADVRASVAAARARCGCCCSPSTPARLRATFDATAAALKYYGEWFGPYPYGYITIVDPAFQSGARRHGVPDALHRRRALARAAARAGARARDDPRSRPPVVVRHGRQQRIRARLDGRGAQHIFGSADDGGGGVSELPRPAILRRLRAVGDRRHPAGHAPPIGNRLTGYRDNAEADVPSTPDLSATGRRRRRSSPTTRRRCGCTRSNASSGGRCFRRSCPPTSERWKFRHPQPDDFFAVVNEVTGEDMTWFFDQVYRSSNVFDYGVQEFSSTRAG